MRHTTDKHHILNNRIEWECRPEAKALRQTPSLVPRIDRDVHEYLHRETPGVPLLGYHALIRVRRDFEPAPGDTLESLHRLMASIDKAGAHERAHPIESDIALLAIECLTLQRNILRGNIIT